MKIIKKDQEGLLIEIIEKAVLSSVFKKHLILDGQKAIMKEFGQTLNVRKGFTINFESQAEDSKNVFEERQNELTIYIPNSKIVRSDELIEEELDLVAGGGYIESFEKVIESGAQEYRRIKNAISKLFN